MILPETFGLTLNIVTWSGFHSGQVLMYAGGVESSFLPLLLWCDIPSSLLFIPYNFYYLAIILDEVRNGINSSY